MSVRNLNFQVAQKVFSNFDRFQAILSKIAKKKLTRNEAFIILCFISGLLDERDLEYSGLEFKQEYNKDEIIRRLNK